MVPEQAPLTVPDVAQALAISRFTVYQLIKRGELPAFRVGNRLRIEPAALQAFKHGALSVPGQATAKGGLPPNDRTMMRVDGEGQSPRWLTLAELQAVGATAVTATRLGAHTFAQHRYRGVLLHDLLMSRGLAQPVAAWRDALSHYVLAAGHDGHAVVVALGEIDPAYGNVPIVVAWERDGVPLTADGPLLLVVPSDHRGGRYVRGLARLSVRDGARDMTPGRKEFRVADGAHH